MKLLFVTYSRTGYTERAVEVLKDSLSAEIMGIPRTHAVEALREKSGHETRIIHIKTVKSLGFLSALWHSIKRKLTPIEAVKPQPDMATYDAVVLAYPIWANMPASPMRSFLTGHTGAKRWFAIQTHGAEKPFPEALTEAERLMGGPCAASIDLCAMEGDALRTRMQAFAETLRQSMTSGT